MKHLFPLVLLALLITACIGMSTSPDGTVHYQEKGSHTDMATQAPDSPMVLTDAGVEKGYHIETSSSGEQILVGPNPTTPFLPWIPAPYAPLVGALGMVFARLTSKAGRESAKNTVVDLAKLHGSDFLSDLGATLGIGYTEPDPNVALLNLLKAAQPVNSDRAVKASPQVTVETLIAKLQAYHDAQYGPTTKSPAPPIAA